MIKICDIVPKARLFRDHYNNDVMTMLQFCYKCVMIACNQIHISHTRILGLYNLITNFFSKNIIY